MIYTEHRPPTGQLMPGRLNAKYLMRLERFQGWLMTTQRSCGTRTTLFALERSLSSFMLRVTGGRTAVEKKVNCVKEEQWLTRHLSRRT